MRNQTHSKNISGFTLIEVMVALGVLGMISVSIWAATSQTSKTRDIVETAHDKFHSVRVAFDMMSRDINSAFLSLHRAPIEATHDTIFAGEDHGSTDRLDFAAFSHQRRYLDAKESDQCEISYFLADDLHESGQLNLVRRESPIMDDDPKQGGHTLILIEDVVKFELQYFDMIMNEWQDEWDTTQATGEGSVLPMQVRIMLVINERRGSKKMDKSDERYVEVTYGTQIIIPMRTPLLQKGFIPGPPLMVN